MAEVLGSDIEISFIENDIVFGTNSDFKVIEDENNLAQAIIMRLLTNRGELRSHKDYGSNLYLLIGQNIDDSALNIASSYVYSSLGEESRIKTIDELEVDFRQINGKPTLVIFLKVTTIENDIELNLVVNYSL